jgi:hypothetical protein
MFLWTLTSMNLFYFNAFSTETLKYEHKKEIVSVGLHGLHLQRLKECWTSAIKRETVLPTLHGLWISIAIHNNSRLADQLQALPRLSINFACDSDLSRKSQGSVTSRRIRRLRPGSELAILDTRGQHANH